MARNRLPNSMMGTSAIPAACFCSMHVLASSSETQDVTASGRDEAAGRQDTVGGANWAELSKRQLVSVLPWLPASALPQHYRCIATALPAATESDLGGEAKFKGVWGEEVSENEQEARQLYKAAIARSRAARQRGHHAQALSEIESAVPDSAEDSLLWRAMGTTQAALGVSDNDARVNVAEKGSNPVGVFRMAVGAHTSHWDVCAQRQLVRWVCHEEQSASGGVAI